jgi:hypothetical protein
MARVAATLLVAGCWPGQQGWLGNRQGLQLLHAEDDETGDYDWGDDCSKDRRLKRRRETQLEALRDLLTTVPASGSMEPAGQSLGAALVAAFAEVDLQGLDAAGAEGEMPRFPQFFPKKRQM